jgi:hypothetical protein
MPEPEFSYMFTRSERNIFTEIYFPKRAAYQGAVFDALRFGFEEKRVKRYLRKKIRELRNEFKNLPSILDPHEYTTTERRRTVPSIQEVRERINMYKSPFMGWSVYSVDGMFFDEDTEEKFEETTQVVRIMFRFRSSAKYQAAATEAHCHDVLRSILFWVIAQQGRLDDHKGWSDSEKAQFIARHEPWLPAKRAFVEQHFTEIAREAAQWSGDRALFLFGFLVRQFWENVIKEKMFEAEIWVTSFFDQQLNVIERFEAKPPPRT